MDDPGRFQGIDWGEWVPGKDLWSLENSSTTRWMENGITHTKKGLSYLRGAGSLPKELDVALEQSL